jgi:hypothetical protein
MAPILTPELLELERTQIDLAKWVDATIDEFGASPEGKKAYRLKQGNCVKQFVEEVVPMSWFANAYYKGEEDVLFKVVLGNQSYDAIVLDAKGQERFYLQVTLAFDGYQSHLRMLHMTRFGHAPMSGVKLAKDANGNIPEAYAECENKDERRAAEFQQILEAVRRKAGKRYEKNTHLIVSFRSDGIVDNEYMRRLDEFIRSDVLTIENYFQELVFVSGIPEHHLRYEANAT